MNIALMTNNYKPFVGGVPISVELLAQGLLAVRSCCKAPPVSKRFTPGRSGCF